LSAETNNDFAQQTSGRFIWLVASSHPADEAIAIAAHHHLLAHDPNALLIVAPRDITNGQQIVDTANAAGLTASRRSGGDPMDRQIYVADTFGELGAWYRAADAALIGGTFDDTEGHNPWEAAALETRILHGPRTANFAADFAALAAHGASTLVTNAAELGDALTTQDHATFVEAATSLMHQYKKNFDVLCADIVELEKRS